MKQENRRLQRILAQVLVMAVGFMTLHYTFLDRSGTRWQGERPTIEFRMDPLLIAISGRSEEGFKRIMKRLAWSWFEPGRSGIFFAYGGPGEGTILGAQQITCGISISDRIPALYHLQTVENPDCTGTLCSYVWVCSGEKIAHADAEINGHLQSLEPAQFQQGSHLWKELLHSTGHFAGISHCPPGATQSHCDSIQPSGGGNPGSGTLLAAFESERSASPQADDILGLHKLHGKIDLPIPEGGAYPLTEAEYSAIEVIQELERVLPTQRSSYNEFLQSLSEYAQFRKKKSIRELADRFYVHARAQTQRFSLEQLKEQRSQLARGLYVAGRLREDRSHGLLRLDSDFLDHIIAEHQALRRLTLERIAEYE